MHPLVVGRALEVASWPWLADAAHTSYYPGVQMDLRERPSGVPMRHPWETVRAQFFARLVAEQLGRGTALDALDVGAGDGFMAATLLPVLPRGSSIACYDPEYTEDHLQALGAEAPVGLCFERICPEREFDLIVLLDVLEHVPDDRGLLRDLVERCLRPGGLVVVSVPAHRSLFTRHDVMLGHHRRYSSRELLGVIEEVRLRPRQSGSLFGSLLVPRAVAKAFELARGIVSRPVDGPLDERVSTGASAWSHGAVFTRALCGALELDARMSRLAARYTVPTTGLSLWALCEHAQAAGAER
jgi:SAM-dependent methyltransferase